MPDKNNDKFLKFEFIKPLVKDFIKIIDNIDKQEGIDKFYNNGIFFLYIVELLMLIKIRDMIKRNFKIANMLLSNLLYMQLIFVTRKI